MRILIPVLVFFVFIFAYVKYFEKKGIYYPLKRIESSPQDIGLAYEDLFFKTADGLRLNGWFIPGEKSRATLLFCHGNAGNIGHRIGTIEIFHKLKLNIFIFDYRGYGRSEGRPSEEGLYQDARAAYRYLVTEKGIEKEKVVVYGKSIGANVAIDLVSKEEVAAIISESGFSSAYDMGKKLFPWLPIKWIIGVKYDALTKIEKITIPKLIIHSQDDEIVPIQQGRKLFEAAPEPKEFYQMRGGHNEALLFAREEFSSRIDAFLRKYLTPSELE